ncbi:MAG: YifB family Mg chelatase-like AAA ATPase [Eubacteriales bacterium]|nr:YifB family Mg chelatase-like AAA ATPase [Eubacteriales bacterium]
MFSKVYSGGLLGIEGYVVQVEADVSAGLPGFHMVGCLASEVREAEERVRTATRNSGFRLSAMKVTVNLSPANLRKAGTGCDLPVAVAILAAYSIVKPSQLSGSAFLGELGLDGKIKPVRGVLSMVLAMRDAGLDRCFLPEENVREGLAVEGIQIVKVSSLKELIGLLNMPVRIHAERPSVTSAESGTYYPVDFSEVNGQTAVKRATEVAVAGQHNILYIGPPGSGKSMIARRIPSIMPKLSREEQMEISRIYSVCGMLGPDQVLLQKRPFRAPHHTISAQALTGGGREPRPGEISLASRGVLFLDELPEFQKRTLELLRQPLEDKRITVSRLRGSCDFPAHFMLAAAMNPCPCGYYPDRERCSCTKWQVQQYLGRISRPLLDRIDISVEASPVRYQDISRDGCNETSESVRNRIEQARQLQSRRFSGTAFFFNSQMDGRALRQYCRLRTEDESFLQEIFGRLGLSARGYHKLLRVARTIADLAGEEEIRREHLCEAVGYREPEEMYWGRGGRN